MRIFRRRICRDSPMASLLSAVYIHWDFFKVIKSCDYLFTWLYYTFYKKRRNLVSFSPLGGALIMKFWEIKVFLFNFRLCGRKNISYNLKFCGEVRYYVYYISPKNRPQESPWGIRICGPFCKKTPRFFFKLDFFDICLFLNQLNLVEWNKN